MPSFTLPKVPCPNVFVILYEPIMTVFLSVVMFSGRLGNRLDPCTTLHLSSYFSGESSIEAV